MLFLHINNQCSSQENFRNHGCYRDPSYIQIKNDHRNQIQDDISFLRDGDYDTFLFCSDRRAFIIKDGGEESKGGQAITFFLKVPSYSPDLTEQIRRKLKEFPFSGEDQYFMNTIPHLYMENQGTAVIRVVVFEKK